MKNKILQLKISLKGSKPPIWRRILLSEDTTFYELHKIIQELFGWLDYHLHEFEVGEFSIGVPSDNISSIFSLSETLDEEKTRLSKFNFKPKDKFKYTYDFGDDWVHKIEIEKILEPVEGEVYPKCIKGKRNAPPEDCGGINIYNSIVYELKSDIVDDDYLQMVSEDFDSEYFNLDEINELLKPFMKEATSKKKNNKVVNLFKKKEEKQDYRMIIDKCLDLADRLLEYAIRNFDEELPIEAAEFLNNGYSEILENDMIFILDFIIYDMKFDGKSLASIYKNDARKLSKLEKELLEVFDKSDTSLYEVKSTSRIERKVTLKDLFSNETINIYDDTLSKIASSGVISFTRLFKFNDINFISPSIIPFRSEYKKEILNLYEKYKLIENPNDDSRQRFKFFYQLFKTIGINIVNSN